MDIPVLARTKMLLWASKRGECSIHKLAQTNNETGKPQEWTRDAKGINQMCWVPHPRNGIYVPKGHEMVMDDVPSGAASFTQPYWLRSIEGVDKSFPDSLIEHPFSEKK
ncbi:uncharacterized protein LOC122657334 [Telopea speciosissima]|uniref:uncharacterized protein LOC122657334 n=1 Tax=Telopea speciosissima TaxID=54955 RepID=UPI001CC5A8E4|nr:uncharacterized protein LOC122657334 [Telopea speciosissima]